MAQIIRETIITKRKRVKPVVAVPVKIEATDSETVEYLIYFFFGVVEVLLGFRLVLKLAGASLSSGFVNFIYNTTALLILPFEGIFSRATSQGLETTSVLEPATLVAFLVYVILAWGIVRLIKISSGEQQSD